MKPASRSTLAHRLLGALGILTLMAVPGARAAEPTAPRTTRTPAVSAQTPVTLNFVNTDIEAVSRAMSTLLGQALVVDPRVRGQISLVSEQALKPTEAWAQYLAALRGLGFAVVNNAGLLKVVPEAEAKVLATGVLLEGDKARGEQVFTQVFPLRHENANNLVAVLRPLVSVNNTINASPGTNSLVITDYADNLQRIAKLLAALDAPPSTDLEIVPLQHQVASDVAALVQRLEGVGSPPGAGSAAPTVLADPRGNALILRAPNALRLAQLKRLVQQLDQPGPGNGQAPIHVVHLKNADATKLAQVLRAAFAAQGGAAGTSGLGSSPGAAVLPGTAPVVGSGLGGVGGNANSGTSAAATAPVSAGSGPSTGGNVQADPSTNSLVLTAPEPLYRQMRAVIDQLDTRRAQVHVEALIVKVDASQGAQFGVQWQNLFGQKGDRSLTGVGTNFGTGSNNLINLSAAATQGLRGAAESLTAGVPAGLNLAVAKQVGEFYTLGALANFLQTQTGANILSTPNLVALDNEEAKILVGQNVPFLTGSFAQGPGAGGSVNPFQTVERKDVGLLLRVKSQIGEGRTIRMTITQENSAVVPGSNTSNGFITDKNEIQTTVAVEDGGLLVLGGLMRDEYTDGNDGVPGLSRLPLIGNLFKSESRTRKKTNLMVFLRPVVLRSAEDAASLSLDRYERIRAHQQDAQPAERALLPSTGAPVLPPPAQPR